MQLPDIQPTEAHLDDRPIDCKIRNPSQVGRVTGVPFAVQRVKHRRLGAASLFLDLLSHLQRRGQLKEPSHSYGPRLLSEACDSEKNKLCALGVHTTVEPTKVGSF